MQQGTHQLMWDARDEKGSAVIAGTYFIQLQSGIYAATKKLILLK
jgi:hypothetical protein